MSPVNTVYPDRSFIYLFQELKDIIGKMT